MREYCEKVMKIRPRDEGVLSAELGMVVYIDLHIATLLTVSTVAQIGMSFTINGGTESLTQEHVHVRRGEEVKQVQARRFPWRGQS